MFNKIKVEETDSRTDSKEKQKFENDINQSFMNESIYSQENLQKLFDQNKYFKNQNVLNSDEIGR